MKKRWIVLAVLVALGLFVSLWMETDLLFASREQAKATQTSKKVGEKSSEKPSQAKSNLKEIHKKLEKLKTVLAKDGKYSCCIQPSCNFCALTVGKCPCGKNLSMKKPVCPECLAGWKAGQGRLKNVNPDKVKVAPDKMLKKMMKMKAMLINSAVGAAEKASLEKLALKVEGMYCGACEVKVQSALKKIPGVKKAKVSLKEEEAIVTYKKGKVAIAQLIEAVKQVGYQASIKK